VGSDGKDDDQQRQLPVSSGQWAATAKTTTSNGSCQLSVVSGRQRQRQRGGRTGHVGARPLDPPYGATRDKRAAPREHEDDEKRVTNNDERKDDDEHE